MKSKKAIISAIMAMTMITGVCTTASAMTVKSGSTKMVSSQVTNGVVNEAQLNHPSIIKTERYVTKTGKLGYKAPSKYWAYETATHPITKKPVIKLVEKQMPVTFYLDTKEGRYELQYETLYRALNMRPGHFFTSPEYIVKKLSNTHVEVQGKITEYRYDTKKDPSKQYQSVYETLKGKQQKQPVIKVEKVRILSATIR